MFIADSQVHIWKEETPRFREVYPLLPNPGVKPGVGYLMPESIGG